jgi:hypothetical protein
MAYARAPRWHFMSFILAPNLAIVGVVAYKPGLPAKTCLRMDTTFVVCVPLFRRGIVGEIDQRLKKP